ncbi:MAG: hypothetical protein II518_04955 [Candidatus Methanomethylophilus sp.]|nr:hypothetical protein [Methanomethylophilus sp.]
MKNIDSEVAWAVRRKEWFADCNTIVSYDEKNDTWKLVLHGSEIANGHYEHGSPVVDFASFCGYYTNVTIRRLNAIGVDTKELAKKEKVGRYED